MLSRILEPEVMDTAAEAVDYDAMDHSSVNRVFVDDFLTEAGDPANSANPGDSSETLQVLDAGTGTAQIPIALCRRSDRWNVTAIDLAAEMLKVAEANVNAAGLSERIALKRADAKNLPWKDARFDAVISNSIVHHIPLPRAAFVQFVRVLKPGGFLFVRDLLRPDNAETLAELVRTYTGAENAHQQQMFRDSLHAAFTLDEMQSLLAEMNIPPEHVRQTTDRHWTLSTRVHPGDDEPRP